MNKAGAGNAAEVMMAELALKNGEKPGREGVRARR